MSRGHHRRNYYRPEINGAVKHRCNKENKADFDKFRRLERKSAHINGQLGAEAGTSENTDHQQKKKTD